MGELWTAFFVMTRETKIFYYIAIGVLVVSLVLIFTNVDRLK